MVGLGGGLQLSIPSDLLNVTLAISRVCIVSSTIEIYTENLNKNMGRRLHTPAM